MSYLNFAWIPFLAVSLPILYTVASSIGIAGVSGALLCNVLSAFRPLCRGFPSLSFYKICASIVLFQGLSTFNLVTAAVFASPFCATSSLSRKATLFVSFLSPLSRRYLHWTSMGGAGVAPTKLLRGCRGRLLQMAPSLCAIVKLRSIARSLPSRPAF